MCLSNRHSPDRTREGYRKTMTDEAPPPPPHDDDDAQEENEVPRAEREQRRQKEADDAAAAADPAEARGKRGWKTAAAAGLGLGTDEVHSAAGHATLDESQRRGDARTGVGARTGGNR